MRTRADRMAELMRDEVAGERATVRAENARLRRALRELIEMVIPATGVEVTPKTRAAARDGLMAYLNLTAGDLDPLEETQE